MSAERILSQAQGEALAQQLASLAQGGGGTVPELTSWWTGELRWGRNRVTLASDRREVCLNVRRDVYGTWGQATTNQVDAASLEGVVRAAERSALARARRGNWWAAPHFFYDQPLPFSLPRPTIWSDATYNLTAEVRGEIARALVEAAEARELLSAGYLEVRAGSRLWFFHGKPQYTAYTQAQCAMTVRDPAGRASGWAGGSSYDWAQLDGPGLAKRALAKCEASRNPVALEPGRYTVVLEPQAVADLLEPLMQSFDRESAEGQGMCPVVPFQLACNQSKLGLKVIDERLTLRHDPADPLLGVLPEVGQQPTTWIEHGVLTALAHGRRYALDQGLGDRPVLPPEVGYRLSGGPTPIEEMIATTKRGLLVTRFSGIKVLESKSVLATGLTRDGLWLIENGKVTRPVKNFRFTESPLFVLNQLERNGLGVPVPVFRPVKSPDVEIIQFDIPEGQQVYRPLLTPAIVPPLKARDFSFTSMVDAV